MAAEIPGQEDSQGWSRGVKAQNVLDIVLEEDTEVLDEVVVTGYTTQRKADLTGAVSVVSMDDLSKQNENNPMKALQGRVPGMNITADGNPSGSTTIRIRGIGTLNNNDPLYIIDGVPTKGGMHELNGNDIESIQVLKDAASASIYGSRAANGVIIITTKKGKEGRVNITVNSNVEFNAPLVMPRFQTRYGTGIGGVKDDNSSRSWGPKLTEARYFGYNPRDDYFQTGVIGTESVSFSTGSEKNQTYASAAAVNSKGIVPNNKYDRYNFNVRNTTSFLDDKMTLDVNASYILQKDRNMVNQGTYNNPLVGAYLFPRGNDWEDIKMYERYDVARKIYTQYWPTGDGNMTMQNPYWVNYRNLRENKKDRYMLGASLNYQILDWLNVSGRVRLDNSNNDYTEKAYASTNTQLTELSDRGLYGISRSYEKQLYADFLVSVNKTFGEKWSLQANIDRKSTRLNSSHVALSRMPSSA